MREAMQDRIRRQPIFARVYEHENPDDDSDSDNDDDGDEESDNERMLHESGRGDDDDDDDDAMDAEESMLKLGVSQHPIDTGLLRQQQQHQEDAEEEEDNDGDDDTAVVARRRRMEEQERKRRDRDLRKQKRREERDRDLKRKLLETNYMRKLKQKYGIRDDEVQIGKRDIVQARKRLGDEVEDDNDMHSGDADNNDGGGVGTASRRGNSKRQNRDANVIALFVEHVVVSDFSQLSIARVIVVAVDQQEAVYDEFVKQTKPVSDYRTDLTGIKPQMFDFAVSMGKVREDLASLIRNRMVVICYNLREEDLRPLGLMRHLSTVRDLSFYDPLLEETHFLCRETFDQYMIKFTGFMPVQKEAHHMTSVDKAQALMHIYMAFAGQFVTFFTKTHTPKQLLEKRQSYLQRLAKRALRNKSDIRAADVDDPSDLNALALADVVVRPVDPVQEDREEKKKITKLRQVRQYLDTTVDSLLDEMKRSTYTDNTNT